MSAIECQEKDIRKKQLKRHFVMQKAVGGVWRLAAVMPGVRFIAQIMTKTVAVGNSVLQVYGVRPPTQLIMANKFGGLSIIAFPPKPINKRPTT